MVDELPLLELIEGRGQTQWCVATAIVCIWGPEDGVLACGGGRFKVEHLLDRICFKLHEAKAYLSRLVAYQLRHPEAL